MTKSGVNAMLLDIFGDEDFVKLWWGLTLPGFGGERPVNVWETDPEAVENYVKNYVDTPAE